MIAPRRGPREPGRSEGIRRPRLRRDPARDLGGAAEPEPGARERRRTPRGVDVTHWEAGGASWSGPNGVGNGRRPARSRIRVAPVSRSGPGGLARAGRSPACGVAESTRGLRSWGGVRSARAQTRANCRFPHTIPAFRAGVKVRRGRRRRGPRSRALRRSPHRRIHGARAPHNVCSPLPPRRHASAPATMDGIAAHRMGSLHIGHASPMRSGPSQQRKPCTAEDTADSAGMPSGSSIPGRMRKARSTMSFRESWTARGALRCAVATGAAPTERSTTSRRAASIAAGLAWSARSPWRGYATARTVARRDPRRHVRKAREIH